MIHSCLLTFDEGENLWDITYVTNCADALVLAADNLVSSRTVAGQALFISNNEPVPFRALCLAVWAHFEHYPLFELHVPESLARLAGFFGECVTWITGRSATLSRGSVRDACAIRYCNCSKAERLIGYRPRVGLEEGIRISCKVSLLATNVSAYMQLLTIMSKAYIEKLCQKTIG